MIITKPAFAIGSLVLNTILIGLLLFFVIKFLPKENNHSHHEHIPTFSMKKEFHLTEMKYSKDCVADIPEYLNTEISINNSSTFEIIEKNCIVQKNYLEKGKYNLTVTIKNIDNNESMKIEMHFNVDPRTKGLFDKNELNIVKNENKEVKLTLLKNYINYATDAPINSIIYKKTEEMKTLTRNYMTFTTDELSQIDSFTIFANDDKEFVGEKIKICKYTEKIPPVFVTTNFIYNVNDNNEMIIEAGTKTDCKIDKPTFTIEQNDLMPFDVTRNGKIILKTGKSAENVTLTVTATTEIGQSTKDIKITVLPIKILNKS